MGKLCTIFSIRVYYSPFACAAQEFFGSKTRLRCSSVFYGLICNIVLKQFLIQLAVIVWVSISIEGSSFVQIHMLPFYQCPDFAKILSSRVFDLHGSIRRTPCGYVPLQAQTQWQIGVG